jgi:hypothetical protein
MGNVQHLLVVLLNQPIHQSTHNTPSAPETSTDAVAHWVVADTALFDEVVPDPVVDELPWGIGVAIGVVGEYVTPLAVAATSNTEPPPYS